MKISDLAALVTVRNHINVVMNDKGVSSKDDFRTLNDVRVKLDKKFIEVLKGTDVEDLFPNELLLVKVGDDNYKPTALELENWRSVFEASKNDPDFKIFSHNAVSVVKFELNKDGGITIVPADSLPTVEIGSSAIRDLHEATANIEKKVTQSSQMSFDQSLDLSSSNGFLEDSTQDHPNNDSNQEPIKKFRGEVKQEPIEDPEEAELALIAERVKAQKELLKKQGRSNKRVSKKDDPKE
jgi:hypothetical protein